jgi:membrane protein
MATLSQIGWMARFAAVRDFFAHRIWEARLDELPKRAAFGYRSARLLYCSAHGLLFSDRLHLRAAALTYYTVLSLVPLLAFAFALLKGFGAYDALIEQSVRPAVLDTFTGNPALRDALEQTLEFVERTGVASLGALGLLALLYTATRLLRNIEGALNDLWRARQARSPVEQLRDYVAIIVVTPLCLLLAGAVGAFAQAIDVVRSLQAKLGLGGLLEWAFGAFAPLFIAFIGLVFLYHVMPNTAVRTRSAVIGAVIGALLWYAALVLHVRFQLGVARFNAVYAGFAVLPIFLVWLNVSWLTVLVGAEIAVTHQYEQVSRQQRRADAAGPVLREALTLSAMIQISRALIEGDEVPRLTELSRTLDAPDPLLRELLERMAAERLLKAGGSSEDPQWLLARLPQHIQVKEILDALHGTTAERRDALAERASLDPSAVALLRQVDDELAGSPSNRTLSDLVESRAATGPTPRGARP